MRETQTNWIVVILVNEDWPVAQLVRAIDSSRRCRLGVIRGREAVKVGGTPLGQSRAKPEREGVETRRLPPHVGEGIVHGGQQCPQT